jgi:hypothetical protein
LWVEVLPLFLQDPASLPSIEHIPTTLDEEDRIRHPKSFRLPSFFARDFSERTASVLERKRFHRVFVICQAWVNSISRDELGAHTCPLGVHGEHHREGGRNTKRV